MRACRRYAFFIAKDRKFFFLRLNRTDFFFVVGLYVRIRLYNEYAFFRVEDERVSGFYTGIFIGNA